MKKEDHFKNLKKLFRENHAYILRKNRKIRSINGIFERYRYPVLTNRHTPIYWRYDLDPSTNPHLMERIGVNSVFNPGAIYYNGKFCLIARVEGRDRKSIFGIAESRNGVDNFVFRNYPLVVPPYGEPDTNLYDMRLVQHQDGWIYGLFSTERKDPGAPEGDEQSAEVQCGIIRTRDMEKWERLPDLVTPSPQQRNCVLHPEFVNGKYAFYTRPQESYADVGRGGGIAWGLADSITNPAIKEEIIIDAKKYQTVYELKNGLGPAPIKSNSGWLQLAHGVRNTSAGLRFVLYLFLTSLEEPWKIIRKPGGYFIAPQGEERVGDISNIVSCNGWIKTDNNKVYIYYSSSDTRVHVATTTVARLENYVWNTPEDGFSSLNSAEQRIQLINQNLKFLKKTNLKKW